MSDDEFDPGAHADDEAAVDDGEFAGDAHVVTLVRLLQPHHELRNRGPWVLFLVILSCANSALWQDWRAPAASVLQQDYPDDNDYCIGVDLGRWHVFEAILADARLLECQFFR